MKFLRRALACIAYFFGAVALIFGLLQVVGPSLAARTVEHNKALEQAFRLASRYVSSFKEANGRLPSNEEFKVWASSQPSTPYDSPNGMWLEFQYFSDDVVREFGMPADGSYLLTYWRGEWFEYYASWADRTSLQFEESKYYVLGSKYADGSLMILLAVSIIFVGKKMWPNPSFHRAASGGR